MLNHDPVRKNQVKDVLSNMRADKQYRLFVMSSFICDDVQSPDVALSLLFTNDIYAREYLQDALEEYIYENIELFVGEV